MAGLTDGELIEALLDPSSTSLRSRPILAAYKGKPGIFSKAPINVRFRPDWMTPKAKLQVWRRDFEELVDQIVRMGRKLVLGNSSGRRASWLPNTSGN